MDTKRPYHAFTMIKPKKQNTDFRFTHQGTKHDKDKIAIRYLKRLIIYSLLARPMSKAKREVSSKKSLSGLIFRGALLSYSRFF